MQSDSGLRLGVSVAAAAAIVGLLVASGASAAKAHSTVAIKVTVVGNGIVHLGRNARGFPCRAARTCTHTFHVGRGRRVGLTASPHKPWKLTGWGGACKGTARTCFLGRVEARRSVRVTFVPLGNRLNPYPLGTTVGIAPGWKLTVNSAIIDADPQVEAVGNGPPPPGAQYTLINLTMTDLGSLSADLGDFLTQQMGAEGAANARYTPDICKPPQPDLGAVGQVNLGQSETGNLCYEIEASDASTLVLSGWVGVGGSPGEYQVWFALH